MFELRDKIRELDFATDMKFDLLGLYEMSELTDAEKKLMATIIHNAENEEKAAEEVFEILNAPNAVNMDEDCDSTLTEDVKEEIQDGDEIVYNGEHLFVTNADYMDLGKWLWVTDNEEDRYNKKASGWSLAKELVDEVIGQPDDDDEELDESLKDFMFTVKCNDGPKELIKVVAEDKAKAEEYAKKMYAQNHTTYADDRHNVWSIDEDLSSDIDKVKHAVDQFKGQVTVSKDSENDVSQYLLSKNISFMKDDSKSAKGKLTFMLKYPKNEFLNGYPGFQAKTAKANSNFTVNEAMNLKEGWETFHFSDYDDEDVVIVALTDKRFSPIDNKKQRESLRKNNVKILAHYLNGVVVEGKAGDIKNVCEDCHIMTPSKILKESLSHTNVESLKEFYNEYGLKESEEDGLENATQEYTSANTSINSAKLPAIFSMVNFKPETINLDYGGGKFDNATTALEGKGVTNLVYDPYNRSSGHNKDVIDTVRKNGGADTVTCSNVLNVIKEPEARKAAIKNIYSLLKNSGTAYFTVYEGTGKGNEGPTKSGYQLNKKTGDYVEEISSVFPSVSRRGKLIIASKGASITEEFDDDWSDTLETGGEPTYCPDCGVKFVRDEEGDAICPKCNKTPYQLANERRKNESLNENDTQHTDTGRNKMVSDETMSLAVEAARTIDPNAKSDYDDDFIYGDDGHGGRTWEILLNGDGKAYSTWGRNAVLTSKVEKAVNDAADAYWADFDKRWEENNKYLTAKGVKESALNEALYGMNEIKQFVKMASQLGLKTMGDFKDFMDREGQGKDVITALYDYLHDEIGDLNFQAKDESLNESKADIDNFINKFGEDTYELFKKSTQRLKNKGISTDLTYHIKHTDKKDLDAILLNLQNRAITKDDNLTELAGDYKYLGEGKGYKVYKINDVVASINFGAGTGWCISGRYGHYGEKNYIPTRAEAEKHWNSYVSKGVQFYFFIKNDSKVALALYPEILTVERVFGNTYIDKTNCEIYNERDKLDYSLLSSLPVDLINEHIIVEGIQGENGLYIKDNILFKCNRNKKNAVIPNGITKITDKAFASCKQLKTVTIPNSVTSIGDWAFSECRSLTSITIGSGVTSIGNHTFYLCSSLTSITIPDSVTSIGDYAFTHCISLTSITIPNSVTSIGNDAFFDCRSLTSITIPNSVTSIGTGAFYWCSSLTSITIPDGVTSIGEDAFWKCSSLTSITIPNSVTSIGESAFYNCTKLKNIMYKGTIAEWKDTLQGQGWDEEVPKSCTIHCTDGDISLSGKKETAKSAKDESLKEDNDAEEWEEVASKSVEDSDGFLTDYVWYTDGNKHVFIFGDSDIYRPEDGYFDWEVDIVEGKEAEAYKEAQDWFNSYNGFAEELDEAQDIYDIQGQAVRDARRKEVLDEFKEIFTDEPGGINLDNEETLAIVRGYLEDMGYVVEVSGTQNASHPIHIEWFK